MLTLYKALMYRGIAHPCIESAFHGGSSTHAETHIPKDRDRQKFYLLFIIIIFINVNEAVQHVSLFKKTIIIYISVSLTVLFKTT